MVGGPTASHAVANAAFVSKSRPVNCVSDVTAPSPPKAKPKKRAATQKTGRSSSDNSKSQKATKAAKPKDSGGTKT